MLENDGLEAISLSGWRLRDRANHTVTLEGMLGAGRQKRVRLAAGQLPLNNGGDTIELVDGDGNLVHLVKYFGSQARPGVEIRFGARRN